MSVETHIFTVADMTCDHCKNAIKDGVNPVDGVEDIIVDLDSKIVAVTGGEKAAVETAIVEAGYSVS